MTAAKDIDALMASQDLPLELQRLFNAHESETLKVASRLSGVVAARQQDEVICPFMLRRNLVIPGHAGAPAIDHGRR